MLREKSQHRLSVLVLAGLTAFAMPLAYQPSATAQLETEVYTEVTDINEGEGRQDRSEGLPVLLNSDQPVLIDSGVLDVEASDRTADWSSDYRLGPGDVIEVSVFQAEEYSGEFLVLQDGGILLPQVGKILIEGYTLQQTTELIASRYATYIKEPIVSLRPVQFRPVRIGIAGEVGRPGSYVISGTSNVAQANAQNDRFPTLTQAISEAGGIAAEADLNRVEITRTVGPGVEETLNVNLWNLIQSGDLDRDVLLQSGDQITIPTAVAITPEESQLLSEASFAPDDIRVYVAGEVDNPGVVELPLNSPLNQALLAAGSFNPRANRDTVELVRVNPDGTALQERLEVDLSATVSDPNNPTLRDQDVIVVERSGVARAGDTTDILLNPITRVLGAILGISRFF